MNFLSLIEAKRDGRPLSDTEVRRSVDEFVNGDIPDYQMAAFLMAVCFRGLEPTETRTLTLAMRDSGDVLQFPKDARPVVDKHSTGGVGDKISLVLAPLLACLGFRVPMISGRGLGITGGTLDKLESIPGLTTQLPPDRLIAQTQAIGVAMGGQTENMIPADRLIYGLRDVTATVESIPLITASILSKKLAEGLDALVMDVKFGRAAFMRTEDRAKELAQSIVGLANECGVKTRALLTDMNVPLGRSAGNWLEVQESVRCLEGKGPKDIVELTIECAVSLLVQTGKSPNLLDARVKTMECLASRAPRAKWDEMISAQGADMDAFNKLLQQEHIAPVVMEFEAADEGYVVDCDARIVGEIVRDLGGGRVNKDSEIHHAVGLDMIARPGEAVHEGSILTRVHARTQEDAEKACRRLQSAFEIGPEPPPVMPLIRQEIG